MPTTPGDAHALAIYTELRRALHHGARTAHLLRHAPDLIDLITPPRDHPLVATIDRAKRTEHLIRRAIHDLGAPLDHVAEILFTLAAGMDIPLEHRRAHAAAYLGIQPDTLRKEWQDHILWDITIEIYNHTQPDQSPGHHQAA